MTRAMAMRIRSHALRAAATALVCAALGACNTVRGPSARSPASGSVFTGLAAPAARTPLLSLPAAGAPVLVDEVRYVDGVRQTIRFGASRADLRRWLGRFRRGAQDGEARRARESLRSSPPSRTGPIAC